MLEFLISLVTEVIVATCSPGPCVEVKEPIVIAQPEPPKTEPAPREDYE